MVARRCMLAGKFIADMVSCKPLVNDSSFTENITLRKKKCISKTIKTAHFLNNLKASSRNTYLVRFG